MASDAQINANRENAQKSQGPTTPAGLDRCKMAAVKHGLTGATILMSSDDADAYKKSVATTFERLQAVTKPEKALAQVIADYEWKIARAFVFEAGIHAKCRFENRDAFRDDDIDPAERELIILGQIQHSYSKTLLNMSSELARNQRFLEKRIVEYEKVRRERELIETAQRNVAMVSIMGKSTDPYNPEPTVGTIYPISFLAERVSFVHGVGARHVFTFDRAWPDPKAKLAA
jgi:hypothetical protein